MPERDRGITPSGRKLDSAGDIGLPVRVFLYTIDQIAFLLQVTEATVKRDYLWYDGRSIGRRPIDRMWARNIAPRDATPDWRIAERELIRYLKLKGFKVYERLETWS